MLLLRDAATTFVVPGVESHFQNEAALLFVMQILGFPIVFIYLSRLPTLATLREGVARASGTAGPPSVAETPGTVKMKIPNRKRAVTSG